MKKIIIGVLLSLVSVGGLYSQYDPQFSQYMFNVAAYNPAAIGDGDLIQMNGLYRVQWADTTQNFGGTSWVFGVNTPLKINGIQHAVGFLVIDEKLGALFSNSNIYLQYAYRRNFAGGTLSAGLNLGFVSVGFLGSKVKKPTIGEYYDFDSDEAIPKTDVSGNKFDMGAGIMYSKSNYYLGLSLSHLTSPVVSLNDKASFKVRGTTYLLGGYTFEVPDSKFLIKPATLLKTDFVSYQFDLTGRLEYDSKYWGGLSYRYQDAIVFMAGMNVANGLTVGYSFDLPVSKLRTGSWGSHEIMMSYSFAYVSSKRSTKFKSIRIM